MGNASLRNKRFDWFPKKLSFLERIHAEIFNDKEASEKEAILADLEALANGDPEPFD